MKNLKRISGISLLICLLVSGAAYSQNWNWAVSAGGTEVDYATSIVNDSAGNFYVAGSFNGEASFGNQKLTSAGYYDIFIAKYNSAGKLIWVSQAGGTEADEANGIAIDASNNLYITGYFSGKATFGSFDLNSKGDRDFFLAKYDNNGNPVWVQQGGGDKGEFGKALAVDSKGNILVTGIFGSTALFDEVELKSKGKEDIFIAQYTNDGDLNWIKRAGGSGKDEATSIAADKNGNSFITGWFSGVADFSKKSLTSAGNDDIFIAKYNSLGDISWVKQAGGYSGIDRSYGITSDNSGNCYVTGSFIGNAKFSSVELKSVGNDDCFIVKYNSDGNLEWVKQSGGKNGEIGRAVTVDSGGNIFVCGDYNSTFICNSTEPCTGDWDAFVIKYDSKGNVIGANHSGGEGYNRPIAMSVDRDGYCYITGVYEKSCMFGKYHLVNHGKSDIFIAKTKFFEPVI